MKGCNNATFSTISNPLGQIIILLLLVGCFLVFRIFDWDEYLDRLCERTAIDTGRYASLLPAGGGFSSSLCLPPFRAGRHRPYPGRRVCFGVPLAALYVNVGNLGAVSCAARIAPSGRLLIQERYGSSWNLSTAPSRHGVALSDGSPICRFFSFAVNYLAGLMGIP
jgi:hypothetical protein